MNLSYLTHAVALLIGASAGALVTKKVLDKKYKEHLAEETAEIRRYYTLLRKSDGSLGIVGDTPIVEEVPSEVEIEVGPDGELLRLPSQYIPVNDPSDLPETINIFSGNQEVFETGPELDGPDGNPINDDPLQGYVRLTGHPHIISQDDYFGTNEEWEKSTLTYYEGDKVLLDERETPIIDSDRIVGDRHLSMFGVLTSDTEAVYVRNERLSQDFEIILVRGKYSDLLGPDA